MHKTTSGCLLETTKASVGLLLSLDLFLNKDKDKVGILFFLLALLCPKKKKVFFEIVFFLFAS